MTKLFTLLSCLTIGAASFGQVVFQSDLSSWTAGDPDGFMGSKTSFTSDNVNEVMIGAMAGTSMAQLINDSGSHKRFTTEGTTVTGGETYEIKMWVTGTEGSELRTAFYDVTNDAFGTYNPYFDVFAETGGDLEMLTQTVTVPADCDEGEFIISVRNTDDLVGIVIDSVAIAVTEPDVVEEVSIYDIQFATEAPFASPLEGEVVATRGIVTGIFMFGGDEGRFFIQDGSGPWNGVYVYENGTELELGDSVIVTGLITEFFELTEITSVSSIEIVSSGNPMPAAVEVPTGEVAEEQYEGILVQVVDAECVNDDAGFGQFEVNDGTGVRLIDDEMFAFTATVGNYYSITGVNFLSFGDVKVYPRMLSDIETTGFTGIEENASEFSIYPNPAADFVTVTVSATATVAIYTMTGSAVYTANGNVNTIDVSSLDAGVYQIIVTDNGTRSTEKLIVR